MAPHPGYSGPGRQEYTSWRPTEKVQKEEVKPENTNHSLA